MVSFNSKFPLATNISEYSQHVVSDYSLCQALAQHGSSNLHITWSDQWITSYLIIPFDLATKSTWQAFWMANSKIEYIPETSEDQMLKKALTRQVSRNFYFLMSWYPMRVTLLLHIAIECTPADSSRLQCYIKQSKGMYLLRVNLLTFPPWEINYII